MVGATLEGGPGNVQVFGSILSNGTPKGTNALVKNGDQIQVKRA